MTGILARALACAVLLTALPVFSPAWAGSWRAKTKKTRQDEDMAFKLEDVMANPKGYLEREVFFYCRYATPANLFKPMNTRFNANEYVNFAVWPDKGVLWEREGRRNVLPTLFVSKLDKDGLEAFRKLRQYELIAVEGRVMNEYAGYPWILVTKITRIERPVDTLQEAVVQHMQAGTEMLAAENGGAAARHFEQALDMGLPQEYCDKIFEQLARAYLLDGRLDSARDYLRLAAGSNPEDPRLNLALADVCLRLGDPDEAMAHCQFALEMSGKYPQAYGIFAEAQSLGGEYVEAFKTLNVAAAAPGLTPAETGMILVRRARIYVRAGRLADAARHYAAATEEGLPLASEAWLRKEVGSFYENLYLNAGGPDYIDSAVAEYARAALLSPTDPEPLYCAAEMEFRRAKAEGGDYSRVTEFIQRAYSAAPEYLPARILEGRALYAGGKTAEAEAVFQAVAPQVGSDSQALLSLAEAYADAGKWQEAAAVSGRAVQVQPWNDRAKIISASIVRQQTASRGEVQKTGGAAETPAAGPESPPEPFVSDGVLYVPRTDEKTGDTVYVPSANAPPKTDVFIGSAAQPGLEPPPAAGYAASNGAYASVMPEEPMAYGNMNSGRVEMTPLRRMPSDFTFDPDTSPVIIDDYVPPPATAVAYPGRGFYREGKKNLPPAEVLEAGTPENIPAMTMAPPGDGRTYRTTVRIPGSPEGRAAWR